MEDVFREWDAGGKGYLTKEEFSEVCRNYGERSLLELVFAQLDRDADGRISEADLVECFSAFSEQGTSSDPSQEVMSVSSKPTERPAAAHALWQNQTHSELVADFVCLLTSKSQEQLCDLYQQLHEAKQPELLQRFEDVLIAIITDVRKQQNENERLERSYKREKDEHSRHLRQLEEEMETQMQKVEGRVRKEEKVKFDAEKEELKNTMEMEISELQENLKRLQQISVPTKSDKPSDEYRMRVDELSHENRLLKRQLTDAQTNLALIRSEVANARSEYEEKCYDLETEKQTLMEYVKEHENLTRQISLLHDANKKLHDTNDDLREAMETSRVNQKRPHTRHRYRRSSIVSLTGRNAMMRSVSAGNRSEYVRKYLQDSAAISPDGNQVGHPDSASSQVSNEPTSLADELSMIEGDRVNSRRLLPAQDSCEIESFAEDIDSGHFTMRDAHEDDSDDDSMPHPTKRNRHTMRGSYRMNSANESQAMESFEESEQDRDHTDCSHLDARDDGGSTRPPTRSCSFCSHSSSHLSRQSSECTTASAKRVHQLAVPQQAPKPITQEPERVFKIVLAGDAAVGKSSFIMRLCKNKFITNLNSTLGVDFQTKTLEVDGRVIALQLWDTAGQERFRSIAKSYFRRADGVLLLYDVTYERSFLSVRDWLEAIEEGAQKQIPIMLVGNKSDLRADHMADNTKTCVKPEDGQRLAREFRGLFIESSAKDGNNIMEAVTELSRMLMTNEDLEVQTIGLKLQDSNSDGSKKKSPCCNI